MPPPHEGKGRRWDVRPGAGGFGRFAALAVALGQGRIVHPAEGREVRVARVAFLGRRGRVPGALDLADRTDPRRDGALGVFAPGQVEGGALWEEVDRMEIKVVVEPPGEVQPIPALVILVGKLGDHDRRAGAAVAVFVALIPDMTRPIGLVGSATKTMHGPVAVYGRGPVG